VHLLGLLVASILIAGCGVLPQPSDPLEALGAWPMSATFGEEGTVVTATYADWPLEGEPHAFACTTPPSRVFGDPPAHELLVATDPSCIPFDVRQNGRSLQLRIDRATLPSGFEGAQSLNVILALEFNDGTWSASTFLPLAFPRFAPATPAPS
jgi:hypothetical protein